MLMVRQIAERIISQPFLFGYLFDVLLYRTMTILGYSDPIAGPLYREVGLPKHIRPYR